jgi:hypothetical protein
VLQELLDGVALLDTLILQGKHLGEEVASELEDLDELLIEAIGAEEFDLFDIYAAV